MEHRTACAPRKDKIRNVTEYHYNNPILSSFPSFSLPNVLCDPTDLIWRKGTPFEAMIGRTAPSSYVS